jgi:hypothetical protein
MVERKTSFSLSPEAKRKLEQLKSDLRFDGHPASEKGIVEHLISNAKLADLRRAFPKPKG